MKKATVTKVVSVGALLVFLCLHGMTAHATEKVFHLKYQMFGTAVNKNSILTEQWGKEIEKRTNGRVKFTFYPVGAITPMAQTYDGVVKGITDAGGGVLGYTRGKFPLTEVIDLPLGYKSGYAATMLINEYYKKFKPKEFDEVKVLYLHAHGPGLLYTTNKQVSRLEDLKGMKVRSTGLSAKLVSALGGVPVGMPISETYDSLARGVADGAVIPAEATIAWRLGEVLHYCTEDFGTAYSTGFYSVMNKNTWNSLPSEVQQIIETVDQEWVIKQAHMWDEVDKDGKAFMAKKNIKMVQLTKEEDARWVQKARPILDDYVKSMKEKGLPGDEVLRFSVDYLKTTQQ